MGKIIQSVITSDEGHKIPVQTVNGINYRKRAALLLKDLDQRIEYAREIFGEGENLALMQRNKSVMQEFYENIFINTFPVPEETLD